MFPSFEKKIKQLDSESRDLVTEILRLRTVQTKQDIDLREIYNAHKSEFESFLVEDFTGYIPKEISEPTLKIFKEHGESFQKWILWQSYYINKKALNDIPNLQKYNGMMVYFKVLHYLAETQKSGVVKPTETVVEKETPWVEKAISGVEEAKSIYAKNNKRTNTSKSKKSKSDSDKK